MERRMRVLTLQMVRLKKIVSTSSGSEFIFSNNEKIILRDTTAALTSAHLIGLPKPSVLRCLQNMERL